MSKQETKAITKTPERAPLDPRLAQRIQETVAARADRVFFSWGETKPTPDDPEVAVVELTSNEVAQTVVGESRLYGGHYMAGNIHGLAGGPTKPGTVFNFWGSTVLDREMERNGVKIGDLVLIVCTGERKGRSFTYKEFVVERRDDLSKTHVPEIES